MADEFTPLQGDALNVPTLPVTVSGVDSPSVHTLVLLHGYLDDERVFKQQAAFFASRCRLAYVRLPWFGGMATADEDAALYGHSEGGYTLTEVADGLAQAVDSLSATLVTVVAHDSGAYVAQLADLRYPGLFHSMVALDSSLPRWCFTGVPSARQCWTTLCAAAQLLLVALSYLLYRAHPSLRCVASSAANIGTRLATRRRPRALDSSAKMHPLAGYLHCHVVSSFVRGRPLVPPEDRPYPWSSFPTCPVLFMYGKCAAYNGEWLDAVAVRADGSSVIRYADAGHWFFVENAAQCNAAIERWLDRLLSERQV